MLDPKLSEVSGASDGSVADSENKLAFEARLRFYQDRLREGVTADELKAYYVLNPEFSAGVHDQLSTLRKLLEEHPDGIPVDKLPKLTTLECIRENHLAELVQMGICL